MTNQEKYDNIFEANRQWIARNQRDNPGLFQLLAEKQHPDFLYIGCSDSRVHPNQIMGLKPGEVFIHRNIANMINPTDLSALSVINYAVERLGVKFIVICGHYDCGGIAAAMDNADHGMLNPWLRSIRDVYQTHKAELDSIRDTDERHRRFVELNVYEQCRNVTKMVDVQKSFLKKGYPRVAGWIFNMRDARLYDLNFDFDEELKKIREVYNVATDDTP
ncbi:MAG: carbonic anhydrase [Myxococcales bacterium]|nr:carbonic anhydrase [Myxococcales bacterium]